MKRQTKKLTLTLLGLLGLSLALSATTNEIAVLYDGNSSINRDTLHFLNQQIGALHSPYSLVTFKNGQDIQPGAYKAVVVLNTGLSNGIDRAFEGFLTGYAHKNEIILVSLRRGSDSIQVEYAPAAKNSLGVDAVTAASVWEGRGFGGLFGKKSDSPYAMHVEWVKKVLAFADHVK